MFSIRGSVDTDTSTVAFACTKITAHGKNVSNYMLLKQVLN